MVIAGAGAGINELTAIAGTAELVPTAKRGQMVGLVIFSILPFTPSIMYAPTHHRCLLVEICGFAVRTVCLFGARFHGFLLFPTETAGVIGIQQKANS